MSVLAHTLYCVHRLGYHCRAVSPMWSGESRVTSSCFQCNLSDDLKSSAAVPIGPSSVSCESCDCVHVNWIPALPFVVLISLITSLTFTCCQECQVEHAGYCS